MERSSEQRAHLHSVLWTVANDLRGAVDAWDFKMYVLNTLAFRFLSENLTDYINRGEHESGDADFDYALMDDDEAEEIRNDMILEKGYFLLPSQLFCNLAKNCEDDENFNETVYNTFSALTDSTKGAPSEKAFEGIFDDFDVNSRRLGDTTASRRAHLISLFQKISNIDFGDSVDIDAFGDAYEYLISMYAANAGKASGSFFTLSSLAVLCAKLGISGRKSVNRVLDPCAGSGALMLNCIKILGEDNIKKGIYGVDINPTLATLSKLNCLISRVPYDKFHIECSDTLANPKFDYENGFDLICSNHPWSVHYKGKDDPTLINDPRFSPAGVLAPKSKADYAFLMHDLYCLSEDGIASIICFPGILYRQGAEKKIRAYLINSSYIDAVIQVADNLFFGTSVSGCILILKKNRKPNEDVLFIDASHEYVSEPNQNVLSKENIDTIYGWFMNRKDVAHRVRNVKKQEIIDEDYNLSVSTYVEPEDTREKIDIIKLNAEIKEIVKKEEKLRTSIDEIIAEIEGGISYE